METMRWESGKGSARSRTAFTTENIAVFAPIPKASVASAMAVNPGDFNSMRAPNLRSCQKLFKRSPLTAITLRSPISFSNSAQCMAVLKTGAYRNSFVAQRYERIDPRRTPGWYVAGQHGHRHQHQRHACKGERIARRNAE